MGRLKGSSMKRRSDVKWVVLGKNRDGSPFAVIFDDAVKAAVYAKSVNGKVKRVG